MARRGFLDYVLGGAVGGLEGLAQKRAAEEERKRMADAAARQNMLDTVSLLNSGYDPEGFSMDAPGATPRPVFDTQMVGTRKFTRSMSPSQMKHMEEVQKERAENRSKRLDASLKPAANLPLRYTEGKTGINVFNPNTGESTNQPYATGFKPKEPVERAGKPEPSDAEKRRLGNQYLASQARNPALMAALQTTFANEPELAEDSALAAYDIMMSKVVTKIGAGKGYTPPRSSESESERYDRQLREEAAARKAAKAKGATPVTPVKTVTPSPAPQAPAPAPIADQALEEDRRLYDAAVAQYGSARVLAEYGKRP
jgi:hypothetical protein